MHNAWVTTAGEKMSKSLHNTMRVPEVLRHVRPIDLRYYLVSAHYRSTVEFSLEALREAATAFRRIEAFLHHTEADAHRPPTPLPEGFRAAMNRDLETPAALAVLHETVKEGNRVLSSGPSPAVQERAAEVRAMLDVLGLNPGHFNRADEDHEDAHTVEVLVKGLLAERARARAAKDWEKSDRIRELLRSAGVEIQDAKGTPLP